MALSYVDYPGNSSTTAWTVTFPFLSRDDISVLDVSDDSPIAFTWLSDSQISISPAVSTGTTFRVKRVTPLLARTIDFQDGTVLGESDLDRSADQMFFIAQEREDNSDSNISLNADGTYNANGTRISNIADAAEPHDAVSKVYLDTEITSALLGGITPTAGSITNVPAGPITASNVQGAIDELAVEKASSGHTHAGIYEAKDSTILKEAQIGTTANKLVRLNGSAQLPAVDGSLLTGVIAGLGTGQTYQDLTASRAYDTTYTNTTGRTIWVMFSCTAAVNVVFNILVGGVQRGVTGQSYSASSWVHGFFPVPDGETYKIAYANGVASNMIWSELR